jgi:hypothetical protein
MNGTGGAMPVLGPLGGGSGAPFAGGCPANFYATGVWGGSGEYIDALQPLCSPD